MTVKTKSRPDTKTAERETRSEPFGAPHVYVLAAVEGATTDAVFRLLQPETTIGRGPRSDVDLPDDEISKRHCSIRVDGPVCTLTDLGSRNGTILNHREVRAGIAHRIRHMDRIQVGDTCLLFLSGRIPDRPR